MKNADTLDQNTSTVLCPSSNMAQEIKHLLCFAYISKFVKDIVLIFLPLETLHIKLIMINVIINTIIIIEKINSLGIS